MLISTKIINISELFELEKEMNLSLPIWASPKFITFYETYLILKASKGKEVKALWVVPTTIDEISISASPSIRFFPYASPLIFDRNNLKRRKIFGELLQAVTKICDSISLPMSPYFNDLQAVPSLGGFVEWRHTHISCNKLDRTKLSSRLRNNIRFAERKISILAHKNHELFDFKQAVKGTETEIRKRKEMAIKLLDEEKAIIISGLVDNTVQGGLFLVKDSKSVFLYHSWLNKNSIRGMISYLIEWAISWALTQPGVNRFDFEGSVIQNVDYFFCGFDIEIIPFGYIYWHSNQSEISKIILNSINIPGRISLIK